MARPSQAVWGQVLGALRERLGDRRFDLWLSKIRPVEGCASGSAAGTGDGSEGEDSGIQPGGSAPPAGWLQPDLPGYYTLAVPTLFVKQWIQDRFMTDIEEVFTQIEGEARTVSLVIDHAARSEDTAPGAALEAAAGTESDADPAAPANLASGKLGRGRNGAMASLIPGPLARGRSRADLSGQMRHPEPLADEGSPLSERFTMDRFVPGRCNMMAYRTALDVIQAPGKLYNPLYIYGECGLGKTHLLQAIAWELRRAGRRVVHTSCEEFVNQFVYAVSTRDSQNLRRFRESTRASDVLLLDDVQLLRNKTATQEEFLHFYDALITLNRQVVLTADCLPKNIRRLKRELITRFMGGMVARLDAPDSEVRLAILRRKAPEMSMSFPEPVLKLLAGTQVSSVRELEGLLNRVAAQASFEGKAPDLALARSALGDISGTKPRPFNLPAIEAAVVEYFNTTPEELRSSKRRKSITFPRQVAMYLARSMTSCSLQEIGNYFGGKNHATVLFAERKITAARQEDAMVDEVCESILGKFRREEPELDN